MFNLISVRPCFLTLVIVDPLSVVYRSCLSEAVHNKTTKG